MSFRGGPGRVMHHFGSQFIGQTSLTAVHSWEGCRAMQLQAQGEERDSVVNNKLV